MKRTEKLCPFAVWIFFFIGLFSCSRRDQRPLAGSGAMEATEILLSSQLPGIVVNVCVQEGDTLKPGQIVAQVDTEKIALEKGRLLAGLNEIRLNLRNAQRAVAMARDQKDNSEKKFQRIKALYQGNSVSQQQYDDTETAFKAAQTQCDEAETGLEILKSKEEQLRIQVQLVEKQLKDARITSPIAGIVLEKYRENGEMTPLGGPIVNVADLRRMWIKIYIKEKDIGRIRLNDRAELSISAYPEVFPGRVSWISPKAEFTPKTVQTKEARTDLVYAVKIAVENPEGIFKIGMPADVVIRSGE